MCHETDDVATELVGTWITNCHKSGSVYRKKCEIFSGSKSYLNFAEEFLKQENIMERAA